eukprot:2223662-Amphidinium_carterae.1
MELHTWVKETNAIQSIASSSRFVQGSPLALGACEHGICYCAIGNSSRGVVLFSVPDSGDHPTPSPPFSV